MTPVFDWLKHNAVGILVLLLLIVTLLALVQWVAWIFRLGRFAQRADGGTSSPRAMRYVITDFFVQIINDFRHLLALVVLGIFAVSMFAAMYPGLSSGKIDDVTTGLQAVAAALGGLIGSIIGYYFGESAARREGAPPAPPEPSESPVQAPGPAAGGPAPSVKPAPAPRPKAGGEAGKPSS